MHRSVTVTVAIAALALASISVTAQASVAAHTPTSHAKIVPALTGKRLDVAEAILTSSGLRYKELGGGMFGIVVKSHWVVCTTIPRRGAPVGTHARVMLVVDRPGNC